MIKPNKFTDVSVSIVGLSADILFILMNDNYRTFSDILDRLVELKGKDIKQNFHLALVFLFAIGKIKYVPQYDFVELLEK